MFKLAFFIAALSVSTAFANPIALSSSHTIVPRTNNAVLTPEDISTYIRITEQDESLYFTILADDLADFGLLLNSRVISAYNVSQKSGQCAVVIERQTNKDWYEKANVTRQKIANSISLVKKALFTAKTHEEILVAITLYVAHKQMNAEYMTHFVNQINVMYNVAIVKIDVCPN